MQTVSATRLKSTSTQAREKRPSSSRRLAELAAASSSAWCHVCVVLSSSRRRVEGGQLLDSTECGVRSKTAGEASCCVAQKYSVEEQSPSRPTKLKSALQCSVERRTRQRTKTLTSLRWQTQDPPPPH